MKDRERENRLLNLKRNNNNDDDDDDDNNSNNNNIIIIIIITKMSAEIRPNVVLLLPPSSPSNPFDPDPFDPFSGATAPLPSPPRNKHSVPPYILAKESFLQKE